MNISIIKNLFNFPGILLVLLTSTLCLAAQTVPVNLQISIHELQSNNGHIKIDLYTNTESFDDESPLLSYYFNKEIDEKGIFHCNLLLPPGTYALAVIDDKNKDKKINRNIIGYPLEGYGFSSMESIPLRKPNFDEIKFKIFKNEEKIRIKIRYPKMNF